MTEAQGATGKSMKLRSGVDKVAMYYASNALSALAVGFTVAAAATFPIRRLRAVNGAAALGCALAAAGLRLATRKTELPIVRNAALETEPSLPAVDFSIVVPVYNRPQHVKAMLARISAQVGSWRELGHGEIIIVDDGSSDDTVHVAKALAQSMPIATRVISVARGGPGGARNAGFAAARGAIAVSIDSDCLPEEDWLPGLLDEVRADSKTVAFSQVQSVPKVAYPIENVPDRKGFVTASFAMDRLDFCKLGGFYSGYRVSHQDLDFVELARSAGFRIVRAKSNIYHPMRCETPASMWRAGLNSKHANLFARRHGSRAYGLTPTTPYYLFGVAGNYGSSIALLVTAMNLLEILVIAVTSESLTAKELRYAGLLLGLSLALYVLALAVLGLRVGAGFRRLPHYVATLGSLQIATLVGRLRGSLEYGLVLL
jgi:glycosyltransferase involved in cell wall biosynthesis